MVNLNAMGIVFSNMHDSVIPELTGHRTMASVPAMVTPAFSPRWPASCTEGPSAIGSLKGMPISIRSAPAPGRPRSRSMEVLRSGS